MAATPAERSATTPKYRHGKAMRRLLAGANYRDEVGVMPAARHRLLSPSAAPNDGRCRIC